MGLQCKGQVNERNVYWILRGNSHDFYYERHCMARRAMNEPTLKELYKAWEELKAEEVEWFELIKPTKEKIAEIRKELEHIERRHEHFKLLAKDAWNRFADERAQQRADADNDYVREGK